MRSIMIGEIACQINVNGVSDSDSSSTGDDTQSLISPHAGLPLRPGKGNGPLVPPGKGKWLMVPPAFLKKSSGGSIQWSIEETNAGLPLRQDKGKGSSVPPRKCKGLMVPLPSSKSPQALAYNGQIKKSRPSFPVIISGKTLDYPRMPFLM
ncbi:hypothetical protein P8452_23159 [Trifolium repens]|nr:hypothetical protein P8452_23159 [Trifolium repens]